MKHAGRNVDGLAGRDRLALFPEAHLAGSLDDEVDLLLLLVVPWHLAAVGIQRHISHAEVLGLDRRQPADEVLRATPRGVAPPIDFRKIADRHRGALTRRHAVVEPRRGETVWTPNASVPHRPRNASAAPRSPRSIRS